jgi:hypothetical protein
MATRGRTTFQKAQKERARKEKQHRKAERREQRKLDRDSLHRERPQDDATAQASSGRARLFGADFRQQAQ